MLSNKFYDWLKWFAIIGLHALGVAYGSLADIWSLPYPSAIPQTLDIVGVVLGCFLAWENSQYNKKFEVYSAPKIQSQQPSSAELEEETEAIE